VKSGRNGSKFADFVYIFVADFTIKISAMNDLFLSPISIYDLEVLIKKCVKSELIEHSPEPKEPEQLNTDNELLTVNDLCRLFGKTKATIHTWKREGIIPFHRISGRVYFKKSEVMESLKKVEIEQR